MAGDLIILGIRGVPAAHGGFETFAERLAVFLCERNWRVTVYCQEDGGKRYEDVWKGIRRIHIPAKRMGAFGTVEFDVKCVADVEKQTGTVLTLGYNTGFLCAWLRFRGRTNFVNMDGLEWKRDKYGKLAKAYLWVNERIAAWTGTRLIADHPAIADHLATRVPRSRIDVIPYGAIGVEAPDPAPLNAFSLAPGKFLTLIARPEPENSIREIVRAFSRRHRGVRLVVLGRYRRDHAFERAVLDDASTEVMFPGPIYESATLEALRYYSIAYLHGHRVGGTNPSLVEGLGASNAVIAHDNRFNRWVAGEAGVYFKDEEDIDALITRVMNDDAVRERMRAAARERWEQNFTWTKVLEQYETLLAGQASVQNQNSKI